MQKNTWPIILITLVLLAIAGGLGYYFIGLNAPEETTNTPPVSPTVTPTTPPSNGNEEEEGAEEVIIRYDGTKYTPDTIEIKKGTKVTFINDSDKDMWPASDPHPIHTDLFGFDPRGPIDAGDSWSYTFTKTGTHNFHDHLDSRDTGSILVTD